jgi:peptidyl-prolyl cis-trans isomerase C
LKKMAAKALYITILFLLAATSIADVLAQVGSRELTWNELLEMIGGPRALPNLGVTSLEAAEELLESWVREQLILIGAEESGIAQRPDVAAQIQHAANQIILEAYIEDMLGDVEVSMLEVENYVDVWSDTYGMEYNVRHILLPDNSMAQSITSRLNSGESFATIASRLSVCPSSQGGGNLGWLQRGMASPAFMEAVCQLGTGEISGVVETHMGYHIIQLMETRPLTPGPSHSEILELAGMELVSARQEQLLVELLEELRATNPVSTWPNRLLNNL